MLFNPNASNRHENLAKFFIAKQNTQTEGRDGEENTIGPHKGGPNSKTLNPNSITWTYSNIQRYRM